MKNLLKLVRTLSKFHGAMLLRTRKEGSGFYLVMGKKINGFSRSANMSVYNQSIMYYFFIMTKTKIVMFRGPKITVVCD